MRHQITVQEAQRTQNMVNAKKNPYRGNIIFKLLKTKDEKTFLKETRGKEHLSYSRTKIRIITNFSETTQARREGSKLFKVL